MNGILQGVDGIHQCGAHWCRDEAFLLQEAVIAVDVHHYLEGYVRLHWIHLLPDEIIPVTGTGLDEPFSFFVLNHLVSENFAEAFDWSQDGEIIEEAR